MSVRTYGAPPFRVAVIHGGPGAPGDMAPVARELSSEWGVLEPLQTEATLNGQVEELRMVLEKKGDLPMALVGFSWGAFLSFIVAARYPNMVSKLILVGCGPFEEHYATSIMERRFSRLSPEEGARLRALRQSLSDDREGFEEFGKLVSKADAFNPLPYQNDVLEFQPEIFHSVWKEATELRCSGELLSMGKAIRCSVVAIHGEDDPHPSEGVAVPLGHVLSDFNFILLEKCGHKPWIEQEAKDAFYLHLKNSLQDSH